jgi:molybdopterin-guanine dinucleotide biosynthesis protein B
MDHEGKDSWRHKRAGASTVVISSPQKVALIRDVTAEEAVDTLVERYLSDMDLVLTEGYKNAHRPKIEIFRDHGHDIPLCTNDPTLMTLVSDIPVNLDLPRFGLEDIDGVADLIEKTFLTRTPS